MGDARIKQVVQCAAILNSESDFVLAASITRLREEESAVEGESMSTHTLSRKSTNGRDFFDFFFKLSQGDRKRDHAHWMDQVSSSIRERSRGRAKE